MDQNTYLGLMALSEGFGNLSNIGAGRPTQPSQVVPMLMKQRQQEAEKARKMEAINAILGQGLGAAPTGGGGPQSGLMLPPGANPAALRALAGENPDLVMQEITKAQFQQPGNPYDRYKVVPGVGLVDLAGQNGGPGVAIPSREEDPWGGAKVVGGRIVNPDGTVRFEAPQQADPWGNAKVVGGNVVNPDGTIRFAAPSPPPAPDAKQRQVEALMASGLDQVTAIGIANGRLKMDSFTGQVIDLATGQPWAGTAPAQQPAPQPGLASPPSDVPAAPGQAFMPVPVVPTEGADYRGATGLQGTIGIIGNAVADFLGAGLPAPEQAKAEQAYSNLHTRTLSTLQDAFGGRPSNFQLQILEDMTVKPELFGMGPERARLRLEQTRDYIAQAERDAAALASTPGTSRAEVQRARSAIPTLRQLRSDYEAIIKQFDAQQPATGAGDMPRPKTPEEARRLPSGTQFIDPSGVVRVVP